MIRRVTGVAAVLVATLGSLLLGTAAATAATGPAPGAAAGATYSTAVMKDCFVYNGSQRGCSSFTPDGTTFRVCDMYDDNRYTIARISAYGRVKSEHVVQVDNSCWSTKIYFDFYQYQRICIHTGVEGLGWTTAECRDVMVREF